MAGTINKPRKNKSKRVSTRLRNKIQKASAAKQRKERKRAKKNPEWRSKLKKDPGIPNIFPYKEKLLQQIEENKTKAQEEKLRKREMAKVVRTVAANGNQNLQDKKMVEEEAGAHVDGDDGDAMDEDHGDVNESNPMAALLASARRAAKQYNRELESGDETKDDDDGGDDDMDDDTANRVIKVPGGATSRKAYDKVFKEVVQQADVILYVLDARDPEGTRSREVERWVLEAAGGDKRLILVLNKVDLIPPVVLRSWLAHLRRSFPSLPLRASSPAPNAHTFHHRDMTVQSTSAALFRALKAFSASRNLKRAVSVGVIGYPNVGKSSVINALLLRFGGEKKAACPAGAEAGVTTAIRIVKIDSKLTLLDSPGIVFPTTSSTDKSASISRFVPKNETEAHAHLVLLNAIPPKQIGNAIPAVTLLLRRLSTTPDLLNKLLSFYDIPALLGNPMESSHDAIMDFLVHVARKRGRLGRGGIPNVVAAAKAVVTDWRDGRIQGWVDAPTHSVQTEAARTKDLNSQKTIVTEWAKEFKLEGLWGADEAEEAVVGIALELEMQQ